MSLVLKWVLIAAVVAWGVWSWRRMQRRGNLPQASSRGEGGGMQATWACVHCGVHAAQAEMVRGTHGVYCCIQHCQAHGDQPQQ